jgi:hypothetical protein
MSRAGRARGALASAAKAYLSFIKASRAAESSRNSRALPLSVYAPANLD